MYFSPLLQKRAALTENHSIKRKEKKCNNYIPANKDNNMAPQQSSPKAFWVRQYDAIPRNDI